MTWTSTTRKRSPSWRRSTARWRTPSPTTSPRRAAPWPRRWMPIWAAPKRRMRPGCCSWPRWPTCPTPCWACPSPNSSPIWPNRGAMYRKLKDDVLAKYATAAWYLHSTRDGKLFFRNVQNLNAKLESLVKAYNPEQAVRELRERLQELFQIADGWCYQRVLASACG